MDNDYSDKAFVITSIYMFILIYICLPDVDLGKGQSCAKPHFRNILGYLTYAVIALLSILFL